MFFTCVNIGVCGLNYRICGICGSRRNNDNVVLCGLSLGHCGCGDCGLGLNRLCGLSSLGCRLGSLGCGLRRSHCRLRRSYCRLSLRLCGLSNHRAVILLGMLFPICANTNHSVACILQAILCGILVVAVIREDNLTIFKTCRSL